MEERLTLDRQIAFRRAKNDIEEPPENTLRFAYEDGRHDKMSHELKYNDDSLKLKNLQELNEDVRDMTKIIKLLNTSDTLHVLMFHLDNTSDDIKTLASQALVEICHIYRGREQIIENNYIKPLSKLADDFVPKIRFNCYKALYNLSEHVDGNTACLNNNILELLVDKLIEEKQEDVLYLILELLKRLLGGEGAVPRLLKTQGIVRLTNLLEKESEGIREFAALNLASISYPEDGKAKVQELKCVVPLCRLLADQSQRVREAASLALCSLGQLKETKVEILENNYFEKILSMLDEKYENILLNIVELIAYVAEEPAGRDKAKTILSKLKDLKKNKDYVYVHPYIDETVWVIEWKP